MKIKDVDINVTDDGGFTLDVRRAGDETENWKEESKRFVFIDKNKLILFISDLLVEEN